MVDVFKKFAPRYQRLVRRFALDIWKNRLTKKTELKFYEDVDRFKRQYEKALIQHYKDKEVRIHFGTIRAKADQWLSDQQNLVASIKVIARAKKDNLTQELFEKLAKDESGEVQKMLNKVYLRPGDTAEVYKVFSFADSLEDKAEQLGDQSAFDLGQEINRVVVRGNSKNFKWKTQQDSHVRYTHRVLNNKTFSYADPPTTIDEYGNKHTGLPGSDWGCRCWEEDSDGKPLKGFVVKAPPKKRKKR